MTFPNFLSTVLQDHDFINLYLICILFNSAKVFCQLTRCYPHFIIAYVHVWPKLFPFSIVIDKEPQIAENFRGNRNLLTLGLGLF